MSAHINGNNGSKVVVPKTNLDKILNPHFGGDNVLQKRIADQAIARLRELGSRFGHADAGQIRCPQQTRIGG